MEKTNLKMLVRVNFHEIAVVVGAFVAMVFVSSISVFRIVEKEIARNAEAMISTAEAHIYSELREVEISTLSAALILEANLDSSHSSQDAGRVLRELNVGLTRPEENVSGLIFMGGFIEGSFSVGLAWDPGVDFVPRNRPWFEAAVKADGRVAFTGPYIDFRTGKRIVSFSKKLTNKKGEDLGVLFLDMSIENVVSYITSQQVAEGGYGMLVGPDAIFVAHPDEEWIGRPIAEVSQSYARVAERILAGEEKISSVVLAGAAGSQVVTFLRRTGNGWYIGIATPTYSYYQDVYSMIGLLSLLGFLMMLVLCYILLRLSRDKLYSEQANIGKSSFLARMSHEIRTPLNSILGMSQIIIEKDVSREMLDYVSIIRQAGNSLLGIINDILDFSKIEAGQMAMVSEKYSISSLIYDVINVIRVRLLEGSVSFFVLVDADIPEELIGDVIHVRQILMNLLSNAVKYTSKGRITLSVRSQDMGGTWQRLTFSVEDTGLGIKPEYLERLFMDFMRVDTPQSRAVQGTGLGLSIARSLCRAMGGDISVTSRYGHGSEFTAAIVQRVGGDKKLAYVESPEEKRVVVFEDRPDFLDALVYALTTLGVRPTVARSLDEFKQDLESGRYSFAFAPSAHVMDCIFVLGKSKSPTLLVNMAEFGEISSYGDISTILLPAYCVGVANALNGVSDQIYPEGRKHRTRFSAPNAKVLIVDDISTNLRVSKELMALYGMDVHTCLSGAEAIELARVNRYDVVFMDHMMPNMDGLEAATAIRALDKKDPYYRDLPIIALTANAIAGQREMFLQNGMNDFLAKPIELQKLDILLEKWIPAEKQVKEAKPVASVRPATFFEIEGVAVEMGLCNSGGALAAYLDILEDFCKDADERVGQIEACAAAGDLSLYMTLVHALKGASRSVGALAFADIAARMEDAAKKGDADTIITKTDGLLSALRELTENIRSALEQRASPQEKMETLSAEQLTTLKVALIAMDIQTVNNLLMEYSARPLEKETKKLISEIEHHILLFEYDKAIDHIQRGTGSHT
ncbi:MAG: response regulator [Synergistaceae bacterium]|nr:response regulator [Synergistaceae bacterium]